jgi:hypothetical protein
MLMQQKDTILGDNVHAANSPAISSIDSLTEFIDGAHQLPRPVRSTMLALLAVYNDSDGRLAEWSGKLIRVRHWEKHFEKAQTRKIKGLPKWIALPVKHDGARYRRLIEGPNGAARFGVWILICEVAMKCPLRGTLADEDGPLSLEDISLKTGCPIISLLDAIQPLMSIGWLEVSDPSVSTDDFDLPIFKPVDPHSSGDTNLVIPPDLNLLVERWNLLPAEIARQIKPSALPALCSAWQCIASDEKAANARDLVRDSEAVIEAAREATFLHAKPFFTLAWLLKRERDGPLWNIEKLADGCYRDRQSTAEGRGQTIEALCTF